MENNGKGSRKHLSSEKKFEIVKEVIMGKIPVSEVCKRHEVATGQYYKWQQLFFNGAIEGLRHKKNGRDTSKEEKLTAENEKLKGVIAELATENLQLKKKSWGITGHIEDEGMISMIKAEVEKMKEKTGLKLGWILKQLGIGRTTYHRWLNWEKPEKKGFVHPLKPLKSEEEAVIWYAKGHSGIGYKRLAYQMLDETVAALTPSQVYRILNKENLLDRWGKTRQETGKEYKDKPTKPNEHWHTDIMYIKVLEMWCFMIAILDGYSRYVVGWKIMLDMTAQSVSLFMQEVIDRTGIKSVKLINDNGSQLISKDFREVLLSADIQQIRIRRNHPQSNGKSERFNGLVRQECLRPHSPVTVTEVEKVMGQYIDEYNNHRLHSSIDYMRPVDYYKGNPEEIKKLRDEKLAIARERRLAANREFNRILKVKQTTSYFKPVFCSI